MISVRWLNILILKNRQKSHFQLYHKKSGQKHSSNLQADRVSAVRTENDKIHRPVTTRTPLIEFPELLSQHMVLICSQLYKIQILTDKATTTDWMHDLTVPINKFDPVKVENREYQSKH